MELNDRLEAAEEEMSDGQKRRRKGAAQIRQKEDASQHVWPSLVHAEPGCAFVSRSETGLINHVRQKHGSAAKACHHCTFCGQLFHKQGLSMHEEFCQKNPKRPRKGGIRRGRIT